MAQASAKSPADSSGAKKSNSSSKAKPKPSYKHIPHSQKPPHLVAKRNARERRRVQAVNQAFYKLRKCVPIENRNKRVSKVKTLQRAIDYIRKLERILEQDEVSGDQQSIVQLAEVAASNSNESSRQRKGRGAGRPSKDCDLATTGEKSQRRSRKSAALAPSVSSQQVQAPPSGHQLGCDQDAYLLTDGQPADPYFVYPGEHSSAGTYSYYQSQEQLYLQSQQPSLSQHWPPDSGRQFSAGETVYNNAQHFYTSSAGDYSLHSESVYNQPLVGATTSGRHLQSQLIQPSTSRPAQLNDSGHSSLTPLNSSLASGESSAAGNLLQSPSSSCSSSGASSSSSALAADLASVSVGPTATSTTKSSNKANAGSDNSSTLVCQRPPNANTGHRQVNNCHYLAYADSSTMSHLSFGPNYQQQSASSKADESRPANQASAGHLTEHNGLYGLQQYHHHSLQHNELLQSPTLLSSSSNNNNNHHHHQHHHHQQQQQHHLSQPASIGRNIATNLNTTANQPRPANNVHQVTSTTAAIQEYTNNSGSKSSSSLPL